MTKSDATTYRDKARNARRRRRGVPLHGYIGPNGSGKSLAMVYDTLPSLAAGRPVLSTVHLLDWTIPNVAALHADLPADSTEKCNVAAHHPLFTPLTDFRQLLAAEHCDVLLDEVTGVASSRESQSMPSEVANLLVQLRRRDIALRWSAPAWGRADLIIRECSQAVTVARGFLRAKSYSNTQVRTWVPSALSDLREVDEDQADEIEPWQVGSIQSPGRPADGDWCVEEVRQRNLWPSRVLFYWKTFDAIAYSDFDESRADRDKVKPMVRQWFRRSGSLAQVAYDSLAAVSTLGTVTEAGRCLDCGGKRTAPRCECHKTVEVPPTPTRAGRAAGAQRQGRPAGRRSIYDLADQ